MQTALMAFEEVFNFTSPLDSPLLEKPFEIIFILKSKTSWIIPDVECESVSILDLPGIATSHRLIYEVEFPARAHIGIDRIAESRLNGGQHVFFIWRNHFWNGHNTRSN